MAENDLRQRFYSSAFSMSSHAFSSPNSFLTAFHNLRYFLDSLSLSVLALSIWLLIRLIYCSSSVCISLSESRYSERIILSLSISTHDGRHTFASLMDDAGANEVCIKLIMGHSMRNNVTKEVYTHKTTQQLIDEVNKI